MVIWYFILLYFGKVIEELPVGKQVRKKSLASPIPSTRIMGILCVIGYLISVCAIMFGDKVIMLLGIAGAIAMHLFMFTAILFSAAVINTINNKVKDESNYKKQIMKKWDDVKNNSVDSIIFNGDMFEGEQK